MKTVTVKNVGGTAQHEGVAVTPDDTTAQIIQIVAPHLGIAPDASCQLSGANGVILTGQDPVYNRIKDGDTLTLLHKNYGGRG